MIQNNRGVVGQRVSSVGEKARFVPLIATRSLPDRIKARAARMAGECAHPPCLHAEGLLLALEEVRAAMSDEGGNPVINRPDPPSAEEWRVDAFRLAGMLEAFMADDAWFDNLRNNAMLDIIHHEQLLRRWLGTYQTGES